MIALPGRGNKDMDEQTFQTKFNELIDRIKGLPDAHRGNLEELAEETRQRRDRIQQSVTELNESLDYLRLSVKYLVFDLEATRRENTYLRKLIEQTNREQNHNRPRRGPETDRDDDNLLDDGHAAAD
jgi:chromosome segregation ATPase